MLFHMPVDLGRVHKEIKEIERDKASGVTLELKADSIRHLLGSFQGKLCLRRNSLPPSSSLSLLVGSSSRLLSGFLFFFVYVFLLMGGLLFSAAKGSLGTKEGIMCVREK